MHGFPPENQVFQILGSGVLEDEKTVADYYVRDNTDVALAVKTDNSMTIYVETYSGKTHYLEANPTTTIEQVKAMMSHLTGIPCDVQILIFRDEKLEDGMNLEYYNISRESIVYFTIKLRGD